jgi:sugar O-acyltransferase (sialic acid O-acetyltransferase NeuD family)
VSADLPRLLLIGAGGLARETAEVVHAINAACPTWDLLGFLDDDAALHRRRIQGVEVIGPVALAREITDASVVVCTGRPDNYFSRKHLTRRLDLAEERFATIVHPAASLADSTTVGRGSVLLAGVVTTASVTIGRHVAVMPGVILTHDDQVADYCTIASGARLGGAVTLCEGAYLGSGCLIREHLSIGAWALVGMGAVVTRDVPAAQAWAGVPARLRAPIEVPPEILAV